MIVPYPRYVCFLKRFKQKKAYLFRCRGQFGAFRVQLQTGKGRLVGLDGFRGFLFCSFVSLLNFKKSLTVVEHRDVPEHLIGTGQDRDIRVVIQRAETLRVAHRLDVVDQLQI